MYHSLADIHQQPLAGLFAFDAVDFAASGFNVFLNAAGERPALAIGFAGGDNDLVKKRGHLFDIENNNIARLHVFQRINCRAGYFIQPHHYLIFL